jgi:hypothetical protein
MKPADKAPFEQLVKKKREQMAEMQKTEPEEEVKPDPEYQD